MSHRTPSPITVLCGETCAVSVADADVITALTVAGILEPTTIAAAAAAAGEAGAVSGDAGAGPAALGVFKPQDTAALRAVAVQVRWV